MDIGKPKHDISRVKEAFEQRGYALLDTIYVNSKKPMRYQCPFHPDKELTICYNSLTSGRGCAYCAGKAKYTLEEVRAIFSGRGYVLKETEYVAGTIPLRFECPKHLDKPTSMTLRSILSGSSCYYCSRITSGLSIRGENHPFWKGGVGELTDFLRDSTRSWKLSSLSSTNYTCRLTGRNDGDLQIHHTTPFHILRDRTLQDLGLPVLKSVGGYSSAQLSDILDKFYLLQSETEGIPIKKELHALFHKLYGNDTTMSDFIEFETKYHSGEFSSEITVAS